MGWLIDHPIFRFNLLCTLMADNSRYGSEDHTEIK